MQLFCRPFRCLEFLSRRTDAAAAEQQKYNAVKDMDFLENEDDDWQSDEEGFSDWTTDPSSATVSRAPRSSNLSTEAANAEDACAFAASTNSISSTVPSGASSSSSYCLPSNVTTADTNASHAMYPPVHRMDSSSCRRGSAVRTEAARGSPATDKAVRIPEKPSTESANNTDHVQERDLFSEFGMEPQYRSPAIVKIPHASSGVSGSRRQEIRKSSRQRRRDVEADKSATRSQMQDNTPNVVPISPHQIGGGGLCRTEHRSVSSLLATTTTDTGEGVLDSWGRLEVDGSDE